MCTYNFILALYITCNGFTYIWIFNKSTLKFLGKKIKLIKLQWSCIEYVRVCKYILRP